MVGATLGVTFVGLTLTHIKPDSSELPEGRTFWLTDQGISQLCPPISSYSKGERTQKANEMQTQDAFALCDPGSDSTQILFAEIICTTAFVSLILIIKYHTKMNEGILGALSVSLALFGMIHLSLNISGGCLNPAVAIVQSIFQHIVYKNVKDPQ